MELAILINLLLAEIYSCLGDNNKFSMHFYNAQSLRANFSQSQERKLQIDYFDIKEISLFFLFVNGFSLIRQK